MEKTGHIVMMPSPGMGHLIPFIAFSEQLVRRHRHLSVTIIVPTVGPPPKPQIELLQALPNAINHVFLPPACFENPVSGPRLIHHTVRLSLFSLRHALNSLTTTPKLVALIVDAFGTEAFDVADEFHVSKYLFYPSSATVFSLFSHLPVLHQTVSGEYRDLPVPLQIPGCVSVHGSDLIGPLQDRTSESYKCYLEHAKLVRLADGILINSFIDLEPGPFEALQAQAQLEPPTKLPIIYPVGPLIRTESMNGSDQPECLRWLENQPRGSVLFVSFGSGGTLSRRQLDELAFGLEMSGHRFLWVARSPDDKSASAAYLSVQSEHDPFEFLPEGFMGRTKSRGLVVSSWAPQIEILGHASTGAFLSHCGWNSTLESVVHGLPIIAWPLYAEQKMNAVLLSEGLKVAVRPGVDENGIVGRDVIANAVKCVMEGEEGRKLRLRMEKLQDAAARAMAEDGSSTKSIADLAIKWNG